MARAIEPVKIMLDRPRGLVLSWHAVSLAEKKINEFRGAKPSEWISIIKVLLGGLGFADVQAIIWASQIDKDKLGFEQIGEVMLANDRDYVFEKVGELIAAHWKKEDDGATPTAEGAGPLASSPGSTSGRSPGSSSN